MPIQQDVSHLANIESMFIVVVAHVEASIAFLDEHNGMIYFVLQLIKAYLLQTILHQTLS